VTSGSWRCVFSLQEFGVKDPVQSTWISGYNQLHSCLSHLLFQINTITNVRRGFDSVRLTRALAAATKMFEDAFAQVHFVAQVQC
jgi:hypothetical protein